jgi:hypothetical protein
MPIRCGHRLAGEQERQERARGIGHHIAFAFGQVPWSQSAGALLLTQKLKIMETKLLIPTVLALSLVSTATAASAQPVMTGADLLYQPSQ